MNNTTRQIVLLLGVMSFLVLIFLSFSLTSDNSPDRSDYQPANQTDQPQQPDDSSSDDQNQQDQQDSDNEREDPGGLIEQSAEGLQMLLEDFISGIAFFI